MSNHCSLSGKIVHYKVVEVNRPSHEEKSQPTDSMGFQIATWEVVKEVQVQI